MLGSYWIQNLMDFVIKDIVFQVDLCLVAFRLAEVSRSLM